MSGLPVRIAMWSGPRNISTAMMRAFESRGDCAVSDEPLYAIYLKNSGLDHPLRTQVIASQSLDPQAVIHTLLGPVPDDKPIWYQKHMTLHMTPEIDRKWLAQLRNVFLIRDPRAVLASYASKRTTVTLADIGFVQQRELFEAEADRLGSAPPVVDALDILDNPEHMLQILCNSLAIAYTPRMLHWLPGRRATDGVWAPAWYQSVEKSTGFSAPTTKNAKPLNPALEHIALRAIPHYQALSQHKLDWRRG